MTRNMSSRPNTEQLSLLRRLAAREAARRQQAQQSQAHVTEQSVAPGGDGGADRDTASARRSASNEALIDYSFLRQDASLLDTRALSNLLKDEQVRNEVDLKRVNARLATLSEHTPTYNDKSSQAGPSRSQGRHHVTDSSSHERKKRKLRQLEHELRQADTDLDTLEDSQSDEILALLTRAAVASAVKQYDESLHVLRSELLDEKTWLREDEELYSRLEDVRMGLQRKQEVFERRAKERVDAKAITRKLEDNLTQAEEDLSHFLRSLIEISDSLFSDSDAIHRAQLRHLIDTLINRAWDTPADPYIDASADYHASIVTFVLRANIAIEHPRDARRIRLIDFACDRSGEGTCTATCVRMIDCV